MFGKLLAFFRRLSFGQALPELESKVEQRSAVVVRLYVEGRYREALKPALTSVDFATKKLGAEHPITLKTIVNLASIYLELGRFDDAEPLYKRALSARLLGPGHPDTLRSVNDLAVLYTRQGRYAEAEPLCNRALSAKERMLGPQHPATLISVINLASLCEKQGRHGEAELLYNRVLTTRESVLGLTHPETLMSVDYLAAFYARQGRYFEAEQLYERAMVAREQVLGAEHAETLASVTNLAAVYASQARYAEAEPLYERALAICERVLGAEHQKTLEVISELASLYTTQGRHDEAKPLCERLLTASERVLGPEHPETLRSINAIAELYTVQGQYAEAEALYQRALTSRERMLGAEHPDTLYSISNLALLYTLEGRQDEAEPLCQRGLGASERALGADHPQTVTFVSNLGFIYAKQARYIEAEPLYQRALRASEQMYGPGHPHTLGSTLDLAILYATIGQPGTAFELLERGQQAQTSALLRHLSISSENLGALAIRRAETGLSALISLTWREFGSSSPHVRSTADVVLRRKAIGLEAAASRRQILLSDRYPDLQSRIEQWMALHMRITRKTLDGPGAGEEPQRHLAILNELEEQLEQHERELARQIPELDLEMKFQKADRHAVAFALPKGSTLVEFLRFYSFDCKDVLASKDKKLDLTARYIAFALPAGEPDGVRMVDLGEAEPIDQMIEEFRRTLAVRLPDRSRHIEAQPQEGQREALGEELRRMLFDPLLLKSDGLAPVFLATDGELSQLPFEALPSSDGRYIVDDFEISYLNTGRDLLRFQMKPGASPGDAMVAADPAFRLNGSAAGTTTESPYSSYGLLARNLMRAGIGVFTPLPGTRFEGERVARRLGVTPWLADQVLEAPLKRLRSPKVIHMATHGYFVAPEPMQPSENPHDFKMPHFLNRIEVLCGHHNPMFRSGLALAGSQNFLEWQPLPAEAEDGLLTAEDVSVMDLRATEMVVLSACDTGRGEVRSGQGVLGLRRAFLVAGARTIVMSLQKVDDLATVLLMDRFYDNLLVGRMSRSAALRHAQLYLRHEVTIRSMRNEWLTDEVIEQLTVRNEALQAQVDFSRGCSEDYKPFRDAAYWGVFILHGETGPFPVQPPTSELLSPVPIEGGPPVAPRTPIRG